MVLSLLRWRSTAAVLALVIAGSGCEHILGIEPGRARGADGGCEGNDPNCKSGAGEGGSGGDGGARPDAGTAGTSAPGAGSDAPGAGSFAPEPPSRQTQIQTTAGGGRVTSARFIADVVVGAVQVQTDIRSTNFRLSANPL